MSPIRSIVIVGGGTTGWMAASLMASLPMAPVSVTVVESSDIGIIGVGEATIPSILGFLKGIGVDLGEFVRATQATFKLGIKFRDWGRPGEYWHPFGEFGAQINRRPFIHAWHHARAIGAELRVVDYSAAASLGEAGRFEFQDPAASNALSGVRHALHFDARLVADFLRRHAESRGAVRLERSVSGVTLGSDGSIQSLELAGGGKVEADLYLDCSGFKALLISQVGSRFEDWAKWLPCDRAVTAGTLADPEPPPYTLAAARPAGWRWRIPLQHRTGNGYVYSSRHCDADTAACDLIEQAGVAPEDLRLIKFSNGRQKHFWSRNCVALGLAAGFLEPLESTSIHLTCSGLYRLLEHFPDSDFAPENIAAYNAEMTLEYEAVRDFIALHYQSLRPGGTLERREGLWLDMAFNRLPDTLQARLNLYNECGRIKAEPGVTTISDLSWFYIFEGVGVRPRSYDPLVKGPSSVSATLAAIAGSVTSAVAASRRHAEVLAGL